MTGLIRVLLALSMVSLPQSSWGQSQQPTFGAGLNVPNGMAMSLEPGKYNFDNYAKTDVYKLFIDQLNTRNQQAAALYQRSVQEYFEQFADFYIWANENIIGLGDNTMTKVDVYADPDEYLANEREFNQRLALVKAKIDQIESFPSGLAGRIDTNAPDTGVNDVATITEGLDFGPISDTFRNNIGFFANNDVTGTKIRILSKEGVPLTIDFPDRSWIMDVFTEEEFKTLSGRIEDLRRFSPDQKKVLKRYSNKLIETLIIFIDTYGTKEAWRPFSHDQAYVNLLRTEVENLAKEFQRRRYFRMWYGIGAGMIAINYDKTPFGVDRMFANIRKLEWYEPLRDSAKISSVRNQLSELFKTAGSRSKRLRDIIDGKVGFFHSTNSIVAGIMGQNEVARVLDMIAEMMMNDLYEEQLILDGQRNLVVDRYKGAYYGTTPHARNGMKKVKDPSEPSQKVEVPMSDRGATFSLNLNLTSIRTVTIVILRPAEFLTPFFEQWSRKTRRCLV